MMELDLPLSLLANAAKDALESIPLYGEGMREQK